MDHKIIIPKNATWEYLAGAHPKNTDWTRLGFSGAGWKTGQAGFGFGDVSFQTPLRDMRRNYTAVYIRKEFQIEQADRITEMGLMINYEDGFIAYINGKEVARVGVGRSSGRNAQNIKAREDHGPAYVILKDAYNHLKDGLNVIAIEGHAASSDGVDFLLDPYLILED